mgnify:CR=1 FL=1
MSDASLGDKLAAISVLEQRDLNCREAVDATLMKITAYRQDHRYDDALREGSALFDAQPLPILQRHFAHLLIRISLESGQPKTAEPFIDYLVRDVPAQFSGKPMPQRAVATYVAYYNRAGLDDKAGKLALDLAIVRPMTEPRQSISEAEAANAKEIIELLAKTGRGDLANALATKGYVLFTDRCGENTHWRSSECQFDPMNIGQLDQVAD